MQNKEDVVRELLIDFLQEINRGDVDIHKYTNQIIQIFEPKITPDKTLILMRCVEEREYIENPYGSNNILIIKGYDYTTDRYLNVIPSVIIHGHMIQFDFPDHLIGHDMEFVIVKKEGLK